VSNSKSNKFTPGPWTSGPAVDESKFEIATQDGTKRIAVVDMHAYETTKTNAALIAAAPECIDMLIRVLKAMPRDLSLDGLQLESDITELIRKATGGAEHRCIECGVRMPDTENKTCDVCHEGGAE